MIWLLTYVGPGAGMTVVGSFFVLLTAVGLLAFSLLTLPCRLFLIWRRRRAAGLRGRVPQVVVVGLDGFDPDRMQRLFALGRLPHLQRLAGVGTCTTLQTTLPPISPVAWSSFQTGVNPGKHNIFDFLNRDLRTCLPELSSVRTISADGQPWWRRFGTRVQMLRKSQPFWRILGNYGIFSTVLRVPITYPPEPFFGLSLSAMCTPDLRGTQGTFTMFSSDPQARAMVTGGLCIPIERRPRIETWLPGPADSRGGSHTDLRARLTIQIHPKKFEVYIRCGSESFSLELAQSTGWIPVTFRSGLLRQVGGLCQFRLESLTPHVRLYVSPIHLDPERPAMPISHPQVYSIYLAKLHGAFATAGLAEDTWGLNSGAISEAAFLEQTYRIHDERERMLMDALHRMRRGLTVCVFDGPDRIQHMFMRHDDPHHPANAGRNVTEHADVIDDMYDRMDALVGRVAAAILPDATLMVLSDHGFCSFRRGANLNAWLIAEGYLTRRTDVAAGDYLSDVDWTQTRAYAFGLSGIYLNLQGRESRGIVPPEDAARLRQEIAGKLQMWRDPQDGGRVVSRAYDAHTSYSGPYKSNGPDVIVGYERGYRAAWDCAVGRTDGAALQDNTRLWSGDHCVDPDLVPGVFLSNRVFSAGAMSIMDLAPTILCLFGIKPPEYMDGIARELIPATQTPCVTEPERTMAESLA
ncbi:MAG: alkaline phosphatase family protein [Planctomycetes bacterium]|nr:alkaline phosphatase family protein [Planctomycetota bacterium]